MSVKTAAPIVGIVCAAVGVGGTAAAGNWVACIWAGVAIAWAVVAAYAGHRYDQDVPK